MGDAKASQRRCQSGQNSDSEERTTYCESSGMMFEYPQILAYQRIRGTIQGQVMAKGPA